MEHAQGEKRSALLVTFHCRRKSPGFVVIVGDSFQEVTSLNLRTVYWMYNFSLLFVV